MISLIRTAALLAFMSLCVVSVRGQDPVPAKQEELPPRSEYEWSLKHYADWKNNYNNVDYWKTITLKRVSDNKEFKVKDLDDFARDSFFLSNLRRLGLEMSRLNVFWEKEAEKYAQSPPAQKDAPTSAEVKDYIKRLTAIRKDAAKVLEDYAARYVKNNPEKVTKEDGELLLRQIKEFHDESHLIERPKPQNQ